MEKDLFAALENLLLKSGATFVRCGDLGSLPAEVREGMPAGICIARALNPQIVQRIIGGPTPAYAAEYRSVNRLLQTLADACVEFLRQRGFQAVPGQSTTMALDLTTLATPLPHKTVATRAGAGWIGKCALLVHETYGTAVRYITVLTDAPLPLGTPVTTSRCGDCTACVTACPAGAPSGRQWHAGLARETFFDAFKCFDCAREQAAAIGVEQPICGRCIAACPYTKKYLCRKG